MTMKEAYAAHIAKQQAMKAQSSGSLWLDITDRYVHPFRLYGNVWYVGDAWTCVHLVDTGDGLLLMDAGNVSATVLLIQAIWEAGFDPKDVRWMIISHGHMDHFGGAEFFQKMFGTEVYLSAPDARTLREHPEMSLVHHSTNYADRNFTPDHEISDGDELTFGNTVISFRLCPGHTEGVLTYFFDAHNGSEVKRCGYYGGFGFNTLQKDYLIEIGDPEYKTREIYLQSLASVRDEKVDIFLGNHCENNDTVARMKILLGNPDGPNPFVDDTLWKTYLDKKRDDLLKFMADPRNN